MSQVPCIMTGPENQQLLRKPRAVSNCKANGNIKNVFKIFIVQIPGWGRTMDLTKDMNVQMVQFDFL